MPPLLRGETSLGIFAIIRDGTSNQMPKCGLLLVVKVPTQLHHPHLVLLVGACP
ncbi:hypothetical protein OIU74_009769, partial [Salix koriyanagi]